MKPVPEGRQDPRRWWALVSLAISVFLVTADNTVLALAIPSLAEDLEPTPTELLWIGDSYSFVLAGLLVTMGNVGDKFGRKKLLFIGSIGFAALSVVAAYSPTAMALILSRAAMGVAGATLMPSTLSIIRNTFVLPNERRIAVGVWTAMGAVGAGLGPLVGGALLEHFWWGSIFLVNVPIVMLTIGIGFWSLRESRNANSGPIDAISVVLSMVGIFAAVYAFKELAISGLDHPVTWGVGAVGVLCLGLFVRRQLHLEHPLVDISLFKIPAFAGAAVADTLSAFGLIGVYFFLAQQFQFVDGESPLTSGLMLLPGNIAAVIAAPVSAMLMARHGRRLAICSGLTLGAIGVALIAWVPGSNAMAVSGALLFVGFGFGLSLTGTGDAIMASAPPERAGAAAAVSETAYELGAALGIAVLGTIMSTWYRYAIVVPDDVSPETAASMTESITEAFAAAAKLPADLAEQVLAAARVAFESAFTVTCISASIVIFIAAILAFRVLPSHADENDVPAESLHN